MTRGLTHVMRATAPCRSPVVGGARDAPRRAALAADAEALDERPVARLVLLLDVVENVRRCETIFSRPRREWLSFTWVLKWLVRLAIRSVRIAIWTSGDPVSPTFKAYWLMSAVLRSAEIDIELFLGGFRGPMETRIPKSNTVAIRRRDFLAGLEVTALIFCTLCDVFGCEASIPGLCARGDTRNKLVESRSARRSFGKAGTTASSFVSTFAINFGLPSKATPFSSASNSRCL